ncbi:MAG: hypothetical protein ABSF23_12555 [Terracidiphilus sp.]
MKALALLCIECSGSLAAKVPACEFCRIERMGSRHHFAFAQDFHYGFPDAAIVHACAVLAR